MNRSRITPPMFMATPWMPVGSPNRKSCRTMAGSGRQGPPRGTRITQRPRTSEYAATTAMIPAAITVPMAAPSVPNPGIGPRPRMRTTFRTRFSTVIQIPSRSGVLASPAERSAPPSMKKTIMPKLNTNMTRMYGSASACTAGVAFTRSRSDGARRKPIGARMPIDRIAAVRNAW